MPLSNSVARVGVRWEGNHWRLGWPEMEVPEWGSPVVVVTERERERDRSGESELEREGVQ